MATVTVNTPINGLSYFDYFVLLDETSINQETATLISLDGPEGQELRVLGSGFVYSEGIPTAGTATGFSERIEGSTTVSITGMSITIAQFEEFLTVEGLDVGGLVEFALRATDTVNGSTGDDTLSGFAGNDTVNGNNGHDTLYGANGNDTLNGGAGNDSLWGNAGADTLNSSLGNDFLYGEAGADILNGGPGADFMSGGTQNDTYYVDNGEDSISENFDGGTDTVRSTIAHTLATWLENLVLLGTANNSGIGNSLANSITGNTGNNLLDGGSENDTMIGLAGNDSYVVDSAGDTVTEAAGAGTDAVQSSVNFILPLNVENLTLTGEASTGTGNALNNVIDLDGGAAALNGLGGNDTLLGGAGDDILHGGLGNDTLTAGEGNDELWGDAGVDVMQGGAGNDKYWLNAGDTATEAAESGHDTLYGALSFNLANYPNFEDIILLGTTALNATGNAGANKIVGNSAANNINGGSGDDNLKGAAGNDTVTGGNGSDDMYGGPGDDTLNGGNDGDFILGEAGNDTIIGGAGQDNINGGTGNDTINGGAGFDTMAGGDGADQFVFDLAPTGDFDGNNSVIDFVSGTDKLVLDKSVFTALGVGTLTAVRFLAGPGVDEATTANHRLIYDTGTGNLYYDADGTGSEFAPIQFANISGGPDLVASDIQIVA
jgi:Ca2+-binding RTX toxin-like protein